MGQALAEAAAGPPELYRWTWVPRSPAEAADYVGLAMAQRTAAGRCRSPSSEPRTAR